jgi:hypothetical protein
VLAAIDLDDNAGRVTGKVSDVTANSNLATKVCAGRKEPVAQVPPELAFRFGRSRAHRTGEAALRRHDGTIALRPNSRFVVRGHLVVSLLRPPPPTPPHKGEGSTPSLPLEIIHLNTLPAVTSRNAGGLRSRLRAYDSRQQQLGGFVALARESAQLTTT